MKTTLYILAMAAQLTAVSAFAQTSGTTGSVDAGTSSGSYGNDWSATLGPAMFGTDGTSLRSNSEITAKWRTLSDADKAMIRRDCAAHMQQSGGTTGMMEGKGTSTSTAGNTAGGATGGLSDTANSGATGGTSDTAGGGKAGTSGTGSGASGAAIMLTVTDTQMESICAATKDL